MSDARADVLGRVRVALGGGVVVPDVPRAYHHAGATAPAGAPAVVERFCEQVADYQATVHRVESTGLADVVAAACAERGARRLAVPGGWELSVPGVELVGDDPQLSVRDLDGLDGVLTGCAVAIAETGTIVLDCGPASGRRALTLVPDYHCCVVREADVVASVPDAVAALAEAAPGRPPDHAASPARRRPRTSSSSGSRASTARARWT